ncbi:MAG: DUF1592 domain-containing protein [Alphaproteobacteria bacterium]
MDSGQTADRQTAVAASGARDPAPKAVQTGPGNSATGAGLTQSGNHTVVAHRRITEAEYKQAVADIFGPAIKVDGRFEPELRKDGLLAIGAGEVSISDAGFAQYFAIARTVADQVLPDAPAQGPQQAVVQASRDKVVACMPARADGSDALCAAKFIRAYGERLFRRPLTDAEVVARVRLAGAGATQSNDFYAGLRLSLVSLLTAPEFLFRLETAESDPARRGSMRLDAYSKAARLSYLLWDAPPDAELLAAARSGAIHTPAGLKAQVDRLAANPTRLEAGLGAFFADMLDFNLFDDLTKDPTVYPRYSLEVADSAKEQTLRVLVDQLITRNGDYRDLFTTRDTLVNRSLAPIYKVPYVYDGEWSRQTFSPESGQSGLLTEAAFMMLFSHPGKSSPTVRGVKLSEIFMCVHIPPPPGDVDFSKVLGTSEGTVRQRLLAHANNAGCSSCHLLSDPPGLALENFDGLGQYRTTESGQKINTSVEWLGKSFDGAQGLGRVFRDDPGVPACLVRNMVAYGLGRNPQQADKAFVDGQTKAFAANGYKVPALMSAIALSPEFYSVAVRPAAAVAQK